MSSVPDSQCLCCQHFRSPLLRADTEGVFSGGPSCTAFPTGIPDVVIENEVDHRRAVDGDHGVRFQARPGLEFPTLAFDPAVLTP